MEPLSGAASVIAVASLAIQLADSAHKIYKFLEAIEDAPAEVLGLKNDIIQLRGLLEGVALLTERQNAQDQAPSTPTLLHSILQTCQSRLKSLEHETSLLQKATEKHGLRYVLGALKIPDKKEKIAKAHGQIQDMNQNLHMAMTINLTTLSLRHLEDNKLIISQLKGQATPANQIQLTPQTNRSPETRMMHPKSVRMSYSYSRTVLGLYTSATKWTQSLVDQDAPLDYCTTVTFIPSFVSRAFVSQTHSTYGQISRTLAVYPVDERAFETIEDAFIWRGTGGELVTLQQKIKEGLNPFVVNRFGESMLDWAVEYDVSDEVLIFLISLGLGKMSSSNWYHKRSVIPVVISADLARLAATVTEVYETVEISFSDGRIATVCLDTEHRARVVKCYGCKGSYVSMFDLHEFSQHQLRSFFTYQSIPYTLSPRERLRVVTFFADVCFGHERPGVLVEPWIGLMLVDLTIYEDEFEEMWRSWLEMLNEKGHNLPVTSSRFLRMIEGTTAYNGWFKRPIPLNDEGHLKLEYSPQEPAYELFLEFDHLAIAQSNFMDDWPYCEYRGYFGEQRVPRSFRKAKAREKNELLRAQRNRSIMPGTFPMESEHERLCEIHWIPLDGGSCSRCSRWKDKQARLLKKKQFHATLSPFGPLRPIDSTIA